MKKFIVIALALFLAIPAISFAGSATSRWDVTIGGFVKFDMGYATQSVGADYRTALRGSNGPYDNQAAEYGNFYSYGGETRLNVLIKGPDGWGAKTIAFIEGDFRGEQATGGKQLTGINGTVPFQVTSGGKPATTSAVGSGVFSLRHAYMKFQWENDALTIGHTWQKWGYIPTYSNILLGVNMLTIFDRGGRQPQIMWDHNFNKNFGMSFGIIAPTKEYGTNPNMSTVDAFSLSKYPFFEGEVFYTSDACGKIGPWQMLFSLSGFYGWDRQVYASTLTTDTTPVPLKYSDDLNTAWGVAFKGFIPIIPEKKGNKAGALSLSGMVFMLQNPSWYVTPAVGAYNRNYVSNDTSPDYAVPRYYGGWGQLTYFLTDKLFATGWYGQAKYRYSSQYKLQSANYNNIESNRQYIVNLSYDVNPAIRFGVEWDRIYTRYANYNSSTSAGGAIYDRKGTLDSYRFGAWYFF